MDNKHLSELQKTVNQAVKQLNIDKLIVELEDLKKVSADSKFWEDSVKAQSTMRRIAKLDAQTQPWVKLQSLIKEIADLLELKDDSLRSELSEQIHEAQREFDALKEELKFSGPYDKHDAIVSIYAGAGGTDAQDWTQMLFRMYARFFEKNGWRVSVVEESAGEEAGLKSVMIEVVGSNTYGKLKGEHGVHRLVRLSPFNADNLRQTSFAKVDVIPMINQPDEMKIDDKDLKIDVYRSGGHGGQSVNTTDSAVRITHVPTGITVAIQNERSQLQNKETAMTILRSRLAQLQIEQHAEKLEQLKGPNQSAEWGNQIRSYVLHPYKQVKDLRTRHESSDPDAVLGGSLDSFINAYLSANISA